MSSIKKRWKQRGWAKSPAATTQSSCQHLSAVVDWL